MAPRLSSLFSAILVSAVTSLVSASAEEAPPAFTPEQITFFETRIRPVLAENCYECHEGGKAKNGLVLDRRGSILAGSDYHKVIDFENPAASRLLVAVKHADPKKVKPMPDRGDRLSDAEIADLEQWITMGLPWPDEASPEDSEESTAPSAHWSFQPITKPALPAAYDGHPIDRFLDEKLAEKALKPAARASRATRFRRAHIDVLGLPPTYEELQAFLKDERPEEIVWKELIDRLLDSPHYGERQARYWMDIARYSDTKGYLAGGKERRFVYGYSYRDWLIRSFNDDMAWDQFLLYQLAADKLVNRDDPEERKNLAALGFIALSKVGRREEVIDDRIDTTFRGMMGLTVSCARCHDHKFDPIPTAEYYSIYGIFNNTVDSDPLKIGEPKHGPEYEAYLQELAEKQKVVDDYVKAETDKIRPQYPELKEIAQLLNKLPRDKRRERDKKQIVVDRFVADSGMEPARALMVEDRANRSGQAIFIRGDVSRRGEPVEPRFLSLGNDDAAPAFTAAPGKLEGSGRLEMAQQIIDPENPLTARVAVNRIWAQHFGEGLVRTYSDFGLQGDHPSHPELLDWLSTWFIENGWSVKKLHQLIMTSAAYQREVEHPAATGYAEIDPENRLLWHFNRQRIDFETMRDAMLSASGQLDPTMFGRSVDIEEAPYTHRRTVYAYVDRQNLPPVFRTFDFANPQETTGERSNTTIPMQALYALNDEFVIDQAQHLASEHPAVKAAMTPEGRVTEVYRAVFARDPKPAEVELGLQFLESDVSFLEALESKQTLGDWEYGYGKFDPEAKRTAFTPFPFWTGAKWQISDKNPVEGPQSYLSANAKTGHPGSNADHAWVARWFAPEDLEVEIRSVLNRPNVGPKKGNGLIGRVVVPEGRAQKLARENVLENTDAGKRLDLSKVVLKAGESIDFIVDPKENNAAFDSFEWIIKITNLADPTDVWTYTKGFSGPYEPLTPLETYAQALLMTNEFQFVD